MKQSIALWEPGASGCTPGKYSGPFQAQVPTQRYAAIPQPQLSSAPLY